MRLMWLARLARPDLLRVVTWLATMVQSWTQACDAYLYRAMCYLERTKNAMLLGHVRDAPEHVFVELFADADYCRDDEHTHSTTGGWLQLPGPRTSFPLAWLSKKQTATCRSTTEAETVALSYVLFEEGLPLVELYSAMLGRPVLLRLCEDNTACAKVVTAGYSKKLRHLKRVHRVSLAAAKEQLSLVGTSDQKADAFTKAVEPALRPKTLRNLGVHLDGYTIKHTSGTGLKLDKQMALQPDAPTTDVATGPQGTTGPTRPGSKKRQKHKPKRIPPYSVPQSLSDTAG